jgi:hypothetical protein
MPEIDLSLVRLLQKKFRYDADLDVREHDPKGGASSTLLTVYDQAGLVAAIPRNKPLNVVIYKPYLQGELRQWLRGTKFDYDSTVVVAR